MEQQEDNKLEEHTVSELYEGVRGLAVKILNRYHNIGKKISILCKKLLRLDEFIKIEDSKSKILQSSKTEGEQKLD